MTIDDSVVIERLSREVARLQAEIRGYKALLDNDDEPDRHATPREVQVLELLAQGLTKDEIGVELELSGYTVKSHVQRLLRRWHARNAAHLIAMAKDEGLI